MGLLWLLVALGCGAVGQWMFSALPTGLPDPRLWRGSLLYAFAIVALLLALRGSSDSAPGPNAVAGPLAGKAGGSWPWWRTGLALALAAGCTWQSLTMLLVGARPSFAAPILLWLAAIGFYLAAVVPFPAPRAWRAAGDPTPPPDRGSALHRAAWLVPLVLVVVAFASRAIRVGDIPPTFGGDEANQALDSVHVLAGTYRNPFALGWSSVPAMAGYAFSPGVALFGRTMLGARAMAVLAGTLAVLVTYFLVRRLCGNRVAWITAALLATWGFHIHFSRIAGSQIFDTVLMALALLFLARALDHGRRLDWALSGIVVGLAQYAYAGARLTPIVVVAAGAGVVVLGGRASLRRHAVGMLILIGAALLVAAPMLQVAVRFPLDYNARVNMVGIFQSGWIDAEVKWRGGTVTKAAILFEQVERSVLAWNAYRDRTSWYGLRAHLLDNVPSLFFLLGLGYCTLRPFDRRRLPMLVWWWGGTVIGSMLTIGPPQSQRLVTLAAPVCFFAAFALDRVAVTIERAFERSRRFVAPALVVAVALIGAVSVRSYFFEYTPMLVYGDLNGRVTTAVSKYAARELDEGSTLVFLAAPRIYSGFSTLKYMAPGVQSTDIVEPLSEPPALDAFPRANDLCFVFVPERLHELEHVRATFPGGETYAEPRRSVDPFPIFTAYTVRRNPTVGASGG